MYSSPKTGSCLLFVIATLWACSSESPAPGSPPANGGGGGQTSNGGGGAGNSGGALGGGGAGGTATGGGGGSTAGAGGAGGSSGSGGSGGTADAYSCAPGMEGDGLHEQAEPYGRPPEAYPVDGVAQGTVTPLTPFVSTLYEQHEFGYRVYVPAGYDASVPVGLMVVPDGPSHYMGTTDAKYYVQHVLDNLIAAGDVPPTIALLIDTCMTPCEDQRVSTFDNPDDKYTRFLTDEIIPDVILANYSVIMDRDAWTTVGYSGGGMQAFAAAWYKPELFGKVITHNASFPAGTANGLNFLTLIQAEGASKGLRVSLVSGTNDLSDQRGNWLEVNTAIANALIANGEQVRMMSGTGGHYPPEQAAADFPNAMRWMFSGCVQ